MSAPSYEEMISELRVMMADPFASAEMKARAINLAYEIGQAQGRREGKIEGITELHESHKKAIAEVFEGLKP
jgi:hypothetical protein